MEQRPSSIPPECTKCGSSDFRKELLTMYGKYGVFGRGYRFNVYICKKCGYSENYFVERTIWV